MLQTRPKEEIWVTTGEIISFKYDVSFDDKILDLIDGVWRRGVGYLFSTAPRPFMIKMLTSDDHQKLGKTMVVKKVGRVEKHSALVNNFFYLRL